MPAAFVSLTEAFESERDANGVLHLNSRAPGCRHCGHKATKASHDGRAVLHHPGTECCAQAIQNLINARKQERTDIYATYDRAKAEAEDLERKAADATGKDAAELNTRAALVRRAMSARMSDGRDRPQGEWHARVHGSRERDFLGLNTEIRELERKLADMRGAS